MHSAEEDEKKGKDIEGMIEKAFQKTLSSDENRLSCTMAQNLYNKICAILAIIPGILGKH